MKKINVLLVEDDDIDIINVKRAFKNENINHNLHVVNNGLEAIEFLDKNYTKMSPIVVALDLNMPKMNGIEFLNHIREDENYKKLPVFVLTTSNNDQNRLEAYNLNIAGYILKPFNQSDLRYKLSILSSFWDINEQI